MPTPPVYPNVIIQGKDATFVCSLSNFDAYQMTRPHKAPKTFVFAAKSTDNLHFFENTADYVHVFSCGDKDGENWLQKILLARVSALFSNCIASSLGSKLIMMRLLQSYMINQERHIITNQGASASASASSSGGSKLARAGTRKGQRPVQPLVAVSAPLSAMNTPMTAVFEPGSLLSKR